MIEGRERERERKKREGVYIVTEDGLQRVGQGVKIGIEPNKLL